MFNLKALSQQCEAELRYLSQASQVEEELLKPGHTFFSKKMTFILKKACNFMREIGFTAILNSVHFYWKIYDATILVINLSEKSAGTYIYQKILINNTEENLMIVKYARTKKNHYISFLSEDDLPSDFYIDSDKGACIEEFQTQKDKLIGVNLFFNYTLNNHFVTTIFPANKGDFTVSYLNCLEHVHASRLEFIDNNLQDGTLNKGDSEISIDVLKKYIDIGHIDIDNFHLFWQRLDEESLSLLDMLLI